MALKYSQHKIKWCTKIYHSDSYFGTYMFIVYPVVAEMKRKISEGSVSRIGLFSVEKQEDP